MKTFLLAFAVVIAAKASSGLTTFQICEHAKPDGKTLSCPAGSVLNIVSSLYGRRSLTICGHTNHKGVTNCGKSTSCAKAKEMCNGKASCTLRAANSMFGDPCYGVNKYLDVTYECVSGATYLAGTTWDWYHDGSNKNGQVEFTVDKKVKWSNGAAHGSWSVNGNTITTRFNNIDHQLVLNAGTGVAVLVKPHRQPASKMIQQGGGSNEDRARAAKSTSSSPKFNIQFENSLSQNACIMWKDYRGNEKQYAQLAPGRGFTVITYGTHPWIARDCATKKLLLFSNDKKTDVVGEGLAFGAVSGGTIKLKIVSC